MFSILEFFAGPVFGGAIGALFGFANRWLDSKQKKQDFENDLKRIQLEHDNAKEMRDIDMKYMVAEQEQAAKLLLIKSETDMEVGRFDTIGEIAKADVLDSETLKAAGWWGWLFVIVEAIRKATRPLLTWILVIAAIRISYIASSGATMTEPQQWVLATASGVISFWFVGRGTVDIHPPLK